MANDMPDGGVDAQLRTICTEALLTGKPAKDAQGNTIAVAMPPNEAGRRVAGSGIQCGHRHHQLMADNPNR